ncbi:MAG TPA: Calx-beta domain-containing protein, partial [Flavitalea sp.]|nr:Calx-beta domain-containing protein [Flavitalea sp.]
SLVDASKRLIFSFNIGANSVTTFPYSYSLFGDGIDQPPVADRAGNIYAATFQSGLYDMGTIFRFIPATGQFEKIVDLNEQTGIRVTNLLLASDGLIYGLSFSTSRYTDGNLFSIDPETKQFQIVRKITAEDPLFTTFVELPGSGHQGIEIKDATVSESDGKAEVILSIDQPTDIPLKFRFRTVEGTATPQVDYTAKSGNVHIRPGMTSGTIIIPIRQDKITEGDETFYVVIENSKKNLSVIDKDTALVTIHDSKRKPDNSEVILSSKPKNSMINSTNFSVVVGPNPSSGSFRIQLTGNTKQLIDLRITNAVGIEIGRKRGLRTGQTIFVGERYRQGIYFLTVQSGRTSNTMVLIKE